MPLGKRLPGWCLAALLCACCASPRAPRPDALLPSRGPDDGQFRALRDRTLKELLDERPSDARGAGLHAYDGRIADYSRAGRERAIASLERMRGELGETPGQSLSADEALDLAMLRWDVERELFDLVDWGRWRRDPTYYEELFSLSDYFDRDYAPLPERAKGALAHARAALAQIPSVRENVNGPLSKPVVAISIRELEGYAEYLRGDFPKQLAALGDAPVHAELLAASEALSREATKLAAWLREEARAKGEGPSAIGAEAFHKLVELEAGQPMTLAEFKRRGEEQLRADQRAYDLLAQTVTPRKVAESEYFETASRMVAEARSFVTDRRIVSIPHAGEIRVRETPPYKRYNFAFIDAPGPFEAKQDAYYDITLPDPAWSAADRADYLPTVGALRVNVVHESYPGHFVQGLWQTLAPTDVQKVIGSFGFGEGWGSYVEQMMIDEGFGGGDPETRLGELKVAIRGDCRYLLTLALHAEGASVEDVERRFATECRQSPTLAREAAQRTAYQPWTMAYELGHLQIVELREDARRKLGSSFSLERFHDAFLAHGMPPVGLLRERVLRDLGVSP